MIEYVVIIEHGEASFGALVPEKLIEIAPPPVHFQIANLLGPLSRWSQLG